jgi:hypothetical protein
MQCSVCRRRIRGRVQRWNHRVMCGSCYRYFTRRVHVERTKRTSRPVRTPQRRNEGALVKVLKALLG